MLINRDDNIKWYQCIIIDIDLLIYLYKILIAIGNNARVKLHHGISSEIYLNMNKYKSEKIIGISLYLYLQNMFSHLCV